MICVECNRSNVNDEPCIFCPCKYSKSFDGEICLIQLSTIINEATHQAHVIYHTTYELYHKKNQKNQERRFFCVTLNVYRFAPGRIVIC